MQEQASTWTFLSNHGHVLICLARDTEARIRDIAAHVEITERAVQRILQDLEAEKVIRRHKKGRRNVYRINPGARLRHPLEGHKTVADLVISILGDSAAALASESYVSEK